jgi:nucleoside-diphosphate-sugar epimerase
VACAITSGEITVLSDGTPWRPLIYVEDMARAITWAIARKSAIGGKLLAVNAGRDESNYQVRDLAEAVSRHVTGTKASIKTNAPPNKPTRTSEPRAICGSKRSSVTSRPAASVPTALASPPLRPRRRDAISEDAP